MHGIILKDDSRYDYCEEYLKHQGFTFGGEAVDFAIFPFMANVDEETYGDDFFAGLKKNAFIFSGIRSAYLSDKCKKYGLEYHAVITAPCVAIKNAIPTSEGVIAYLVTNRVKTIANSSVLVVGYGICGQDLSTRLKALGANVSALVRNKEKESAAYANSITPLYINDVFEKPFDVIVNTVPSTIFSNEMLDKTKGALMIDIASKPYGFDMEYAKKLNQKSALLPGIPGKHAVQTAGEIFGEYIAYVMRTCSHSRRTI
ncbi:MAG: hypothetical protein FWB80_07425 [Defluviitaleaceae bacterium]|nr:hypothetical protein [Defluviitaleaceae bacterium]